MTEPTPSTSLRLSSVACALGAVALVSFLGSAACGNSDDTSTGDGGTSSGGGGSTADSGGGSGGGGTSGGGGGGSGGDSGGGGGGGTSDSGTKSDSGTGSSGGLASSCSTGTVFAGDPVYMGDPSDRPASGTGILADPPLLWHNILFDGNLLYTQDDAAGVWVTDTSAASPVETRVGGGLTTDGTTPFNDGPCATAHFAGIHSIALMPDHSLLVVDFFSSAVMQITNPTNPATCAVSYYAGNRTPSLDEQNPVEGGDVDGPGATAQFMSPGPIATDSAGNAYLWDLGTSKLSKIANDSVHTVSVLATVSGDSAPDNLRNLLVLGTKVYAVGNNGGTAFVVGFDTTSGAMTTVVSGTGTTFEPIDGDGTPLPMGIATDGTNLIVGGSGYVWYVTLAGVVTQIAGTGIPVDFPVAPYNPKASQPALSLVLPETEADDSDGSLDYLAYHDGSVYFRGHFQGTATFLEKISCP